MKTLTKPVWSEGMYLGPHHFQAQNRYFEDALNFVTESLWRDAHGFRQGLPHSPIDGSSAVVSLVSWTETHKDLARAYMLRLIDRHGV